MSMEQIRRRKQEFRILSPFTRGWKRKAILGADAERLRGARYEVTVCVPMSVRPRLETRRMYGWQLEAFVRVLSACGEFLVEVRPIEKHRVR